MVKLKLLIITQAVDLDNPVLGFFHRWVESLASFSEQITVIGLQVGNYNLPPKVKVLSLGKESKPSHLRYLWCFYKYLWQERHNYNVVFVHMNQEYVLLAGWWWWLTGKKITMWRNHHVGDLFTDLAVRFCHRVFCTSKYSYTAKYKKTLLMPVGIDTEKFQPDPTIKRLSTSILFLGRLAPVKNPHILLAALINLAKQKIDFWADFYGDPNPKDKSYYQQLRARTADPLLSNKVNFFPALPNYRLPSIYSSAGVFVNLSPSGMYDKTVFEAMSCGGLVAVSSLAFKGLLPPEHFFLENDSLSLANTLNRLFNLSAEEKSKRGLRFRQLVLDYHSLAKLVDSLQWELSRL